MMPATNHHGRILHASPGVGSLRACNCGCLHLALGGLTLNFPNLEAFLGFSDCLAGQPLADNSAAVEFSVGDIRITFGRERYSELRRLVASCASAARKSPVRGFQPWQTRLPQCSRN